MVGIVLHIHPNESFRDSIDQSEFDRSTDGNPLVLQIKEQGNVADCSKPPTPRTKLLSTTNNLEDFTLNFPLKLGIKLVAAVFIKG